MKNLSIWIACLFVLQLNAQIIPGELIVDWTNAGYQGSIPTPDLIINITDFGAVGDSITDNSMALNSAIEALNSEMGVIWFPEGVYLFNSSITLTDSIILRGNGADATHLVFNLSGQSGNCFSGVGSQSSEFMAVYAGYEKGSDQLLVGDASSFSVGDYLELREDNGEWDTSPVSWAEKSVGQILKISGIDQNFISFEEPIRINYDSDLNPELRIIHPRMNIGLECFKISRVDNISEGTGYNIYFDCAAQCWIDGVESAKSVCSHIYISNSTNVEVKGCFIHHAFEYDGTGTRGYGITVNHHAGECLVENNIFKHLRHAMIVKTGANGNVFAYNYSTDPYRSEPIHDFSADISLHGHYAYANLFEGNIVQNIIIDHYWGPSGPYNTFFRNRAELYGIIMTDYDTQSSDAQNFVGNEVSNSGFLMGNYIINGDNQFEYGNNLRGNVYPSGTNILADESYYLYTYPEFWEISDNWPSVGIPNVINSFSIPAQGRYLDGGSYTVCNDLSVVDIENNGLNSEIINIWPNPAKRFINIRLNKKPVSQFQLRIIDSMGREIHKKNNIPTTGSLRIPLPDSVNAGLHYIVISIDNKSVIRKVMFQ